MTYLQTNRPNRNRSRNTLFIVLITMLIMGTLHFFFPRFIPSFFTSLISPFWRLEFVMKGGSLDSENEKLHREILEANVRLDTIRAIEIENSELKSILGRPITSSTTESSANNGRILAAVLERPPLISYDELIIDIGQNFGISVGDKVYAIGNVLIGRVDAVLGKTAKVTLFSSPNKTYEVMIGRNHIPATAVGRGGGQYEAKVARDVTILEGEFVEVPSISDRPFGIVNTIISDPTQPFETIIFAPPVNIYEVRWVMVEKM